ncbi:hypothetical protein NW767_014887 [Fusarium falciforme]|nr:hypothetical protein NW767_014887 [Fusarium falciforme]
MSRVRIPLDLIESSVTGIYMENLISYWCDRGLTPKHAEALAGVLNAWTQRDDLFIKCLAKEKSIFETVRNQMMRSLDIWEEVPAWDEIWRLRLAFDRDHKINCHPNVKLYTIIVCKLLPEMIMERNEHEDVWSPRNTVSIELYDTPDWYQEKFKEYQARQAEREQSHQRDQETVLRYKALTRGAFNNEASDFAQQVQLPLSEDKLQRLLEEPRLYPLDWWAGLEKAGFKAGSRGPFGSSPWQPPDFSSRQQKELANPFSEAPATLGHTLAPNWMPPNFTSLASKAPSYTTIFGGTSNKLFGSASPLPPDFTSSPSKASSSTKGRLFGSTSNALFSASPLPPDFTSSASKAPSYTTVFGGTSNKLFGSASPLPPDFTSSPSKASSSTKAPLFGTREHGSPVSVSQGPEQVKSGGNLGVTVSDSVESEGS